MSMSQQVKTTVSKETPTKKKRVMGSLAERKGGEGKIQWKTSKPTVPPAPKDPHWIIFVGGAILVSVAIEFYFAMGSLALCVSLFLVGLYKVRAIPHDNIRPALGAHPFIGKAPTSHTFRMFPNIPRASPHRSSLLHMVPLG